VAAAAASPVLVNVRVAGAREAATIAGLLVVLTLALDGVLHLRQQWRNYRYTEQFLEKERLLYRVGAGPYRGLAPGEAFLRFVERVEWAIAAENSTTLSTMALAPEVRLNGGPH
jgi:uncharacterized protein DUF4231